MSDTTTPKRNEAVAPVAWATPKQMDHFDRVREEGGRDTWADVWLRQREPYTVPLYRASVVDALQGEVSRLRAVLERIAAPHDCGCRPCTGTCRSGLALEITVAAMREEAREALNLEPPTDGR